MAMRQTIFAKNKFMEQTRDIFFMVAAKFIITNKTASITALQRLSGKPRRCSKTKEYENNSHIGHPQHAPAADESARG